MKYGENLPQRSVLEWLPYNLDYTEVKQLIKRYTTGRPPVATPEQKTEFEDDLFNVLAGQFDRITLFVKSKSGEIERRLADCRRQVDALRKRGVGRAPSKTANLYARIERDVERAGNDIQALSRFVTAQKTGFYKLLKKYKRWSGSSHLSTRFDALVNSQNSFYGHNFENSILKVSELLATIRDGIHMLSDTMSGADSFQQAPSIDSQIQDYPGPQNGGCQSMGAKAAEMDEPSGRAVFWVHEDHLIEVQVLLLKYLVIQTSSPVSSQRPTPAASRRNSTSNVSSGKEEDVTFVVLDDPESLLYKESVANPQDNSRSSVRTAGQVRWCNRDIEARLNLEDDRFANTGTERLEMTLKRKHLESTLKERSTSVSLRDKDAETIRKIEKFREWLKKHPDVSPLAKIACKRTTFVGEIPNGKARVFFDRDIKIKPIACSPGWMTVDEDEEDGGMESSGGMYKRFPHAVCEVRWDGNQMPSFVEELSGSHLVESVPRFSLDVHAVVTIHGTRGASGPLWLNALENDIRKIPRTLSSHHSRRGSSYFVVTNSSSKTSSTVTGDSALRDMTTPATSDGAYDDLLVVKALERRRRQRERKHKLSIEHSIENVAGKRYWNELAGDGSDNDEPYTVFVAPSGTYVEDPAADKYLSVYLSNGFSRAVSKVRNLFRFRRSVLAENSEHSGLLNHPGAGGADEESSSDESGREGVRRTYGTYSPSSPGFGPRQRALNRLNHLVFLGLSFAVLVITGAFALEDSLHGHGDPDDVTRHVVLDLGIITGVMVSIVLAITGLSVHLVGRSRSNLFHSAVVWITFVIVCIGSGCCLGLAGRTEVEN